MHSYHKDIGTWGENIAAEYLLTDGYIVLDRNFRTRIGELDIVVKKDGIVVFVEVKTRYDCTFGSPALSVTYSKQKKIYAIAQLYILNRKCNNRSFRFDVIEVLMNKEENKPSINHIENAF